MSDGWDRIKQWEARYVPEPSMKTILLRGGPIPDRTLAWNGGDEVLLTYVADPFVAMDRQDKGLRYYQYIRYRRSADDPSRFDYAGII